MNFMLTRVWHDRPSAYLSVDIPMVRYPILSFHCSLCLGREKEKMKEREEQWVMIEQEAAKNPTSNLILNGKPGKG